MEFCPFGIKLGIRQCGRRFENRLQGKSAQSFLRLPAENRLFAAFANGER